MLQFNVQTNTGSLKTKQTANKIEKNTHDHTENNKQHGQKKTQTIKENQDCATITPDNQSIHIFIQLFT